MQKTDLPYYVTNFFTMYLPGQKNLSKNTIASYAVTFKLFFTFCKDKKDIQPERLKLSMINEALITEFLDWLESDRNCSVTTRNQRLVSLHSFFRFILMKEPAYMDTFIRILKIPYKKTTKTVVPYLSEEQMKILLAQPDGKKWGGFRDKVMLSVLYDSGARVQELVDLRINVVFNVTPHVFRHSKAVHMVRAGINLIYIRDFLGHVDCCTTEIYARIDTETKRKAIKKACKDIFPEERTTDWTADEDLMSFLETLV